MIGYEFTKTNYAPMRTPVQQRWWSHYDANTLEYLLRSRNRKNLREQPEYEQAKDIFLEVTMSCNEKECRNWLNWFMANAIAYGQVTQDKDWAYYFLAAYDLVQEE